VITALDLCAAAAWRLTGGPELSGGKDSAINHAFGQRSELAPGPLGIWQ
jgi:hypothetical protein